MSPLLLSLIFVGFTVPGVVRALRTLPSVTALVLEGAKPWACDVCMCFWSTAVLTLFAALALGPAHLLVAGPAYTVALYVLGKLEQAPSTPPEL